MAAEKIYAYETLDCLPFPSDVAENYSVLRSEISSEPLPPPESTVVDYFSLEVDEAGTDFITLDVEGSPSRDVFLEKVGEVEKVYKEEEEEEEELVPECSWFQGCKRRLKSPMLQLHNEIIKFCDFVSPTPEEEDSRKEAVERIFGVIKYVWPHCNPEVFGSVRTGLYLPTSDVDVVIFDSKVKTPQMGLYALAKALLQRNVGEKIQVIAKARVPIVKLIEKQSGIAFDISFNVENGPKAAEFIKDAVRKMPPLKPLCMILKIFLQQRELNEVYLGGIGSYALLTMIIAHLKISWRGKSGTTGSSESNLGILLVSFFDLYGRKLNIKEVGISCNIEGTFFLKSTKRFGNDERQQLVISIEDPQSPENDIGRGSFNFYKVKSAFGMAYSLLTDVKTIGQLSSEKSLLGIIIRPDPLLLQRKGSIGGQTFDTLLPGAGHPKSPLLAYCLIDDDEPLPRGKKKKKGNQSSLKRKVSKSKFQLKKKNDTSGAVSCEESGRKRRRKTKSNGV